MEHEQFINIVQHGWSLPTQTDYAKVIMAKFKNLRRVIKAWQAQLSSLDVKQTSRMSSSFSLSWAF
jgi:hypothetical protein